MRALAEIAQANGYSDGPITPEGIERLRAQLVRAGSVEQAALAGLKPDRVPVLPGGLAILAAVLSELRIPELTVASGAMREGLLYDLLGRVHHKDMRDVTVAQFMQRYHVDAGQARRVGGLTLSLWKQLGDGREADEDLGTYLGWAAKLHEIGISVAYSGYHKHSAYILEKADMPGFSRDEQTQLALLVLAHRRSLKKMFAQLDQRVDWRSVLALRLAALFYRGRADLRLPAIQAKAQGPRFKLGVDVDWLARNPLTATALREESKEWEKIGFELRIPGLDLEGTGDEAAPLYEATR
jgi:exopolyphosphatase/guanosine-5'-triphosphate,3'-diphosphate pyrophosphatase